MSILLSVGSALLLLGTAAILPAFFVRGAMARWFRPAETVPPDEVWASRFEEQLAFASGPAHDTDGLFDR